MRKLGTTLCGAVALTIGLAAGSTAASGSSFATAATTAGAHKTAFCAGNLKIDKASANVNSEAGFLTVLKHNKAALSAMGKDLPSGTVGTDARKEIAAAQKAIASGNVNDLNTVPQSAGGDIDTYCGVDGTGTRCLHTSPLVREAASAQPSSQSLQQSETPTVLPVPWPLWRPTRLKSPSSPPKSPGCPPRSKPRPVRR